MIDKHQFSLKAINIQLAQYTTLILKEDILWWLPDLKQEHNEISSTASAVVHECFWL